MMLQKLKHNRNGWSIIDITIAAAILVIGIVPIVNLINGISYGIQNRKRVFEATIAAESFMELIKQNRWDENSTVPPTYLIDANKSTVLGLEAGEHFNSLLDYSVDDIDDFNNVSLKLTPHCDCTVNVIYVDVVTNLPVTPAVGVSEYKQITLNLTIDRDTTVITTIKANGL